MARRLALTRTCVHRQRPGIAAAADRCEGGPAHLDCRTLPCLSFAFSLPLLLSETLRAIKFWQAPAGDDAIAAAAETIGTPEGAEAALRYFDDALGHVAARLEEAEKEGWMTYSYVYTAHPGKHMHALGVSHPEVKSVVQGLNERISNFWSEKLKSLDATLLVTADHGHVTVPPEKMIELPRVKVSPPLSCSPVPSLVLRPFSSPSSSFAAPRRLPRVRKRRRSRRRPPRLLPLPRGPADRLCDWLSR